MLQQYLLLVHVLKIFGEKLPLQLLCTIVNTSPDEIVLSKHRHMGEMRPLNTSDDPVESLMINEITYKINSDDINTKLTQTQNSHCTLSESTNDLKSVPKTSILMSGAIQIHRQVPLTDAKISKEKKKLYEMLQKYEAIISKSDKDIGQTDLRS